MSKEKIKELLQKREAINLEIYGNSVDDNSVNRSDVWLTNHGLIMNFINNHFENNLSFPQVTTIAKNTGLSRPTVYKHLKQIDTIEYKDFEKSQLKAMASNILILLYNEARTNFMNPNFLKASKLFLDYVQKIEKANNNNTITFNQIQFNQTFIQSLPEDTKLKIERLILQDVGLTKGLQIQKIIENGNMGTE